MSLHQIVLGNAPTTQFIDLCRTLGIPHMTLATPLLAAQPGGMAAITHVLATGGPRVATLNHLFAVDPNLEDDNGSASARLLVAIDDAATLGATSLYLLTGGRGALSWEAAAARFAQLLAPARDAAHRKGIALMVENASAFNADIHIAHTLADTLALAEMSDIGVCIDLHACWAEADLAALFRRALPRLGLVQVSDYVLGDRIAPCRAVPGDGAIPLQNLMRVLLEDGYQGLFDLELVGPRIETEGGAAAALRAIEWLSGTLQKLGA